MTVCLTLTQSFKPPPFDEIVCAVLEMLIELYFLTELCLRFTVCPNHKGFIRNPYNIIDAIAVLPLAVRVAVGILIPVEEGFDQRGISRNILLLLVPLLRLAKVLRHFQTFQLLFAAFRRVAEALPVLLYTQLFITLVFAPLIYIVEPRDNIESLPSAVWLTIVTMTTVGYGDITPTTVPGFFIVSILVIISMIFVAFPLGIIGSTFTSVWRDRNRILLLQRTRECLDAGGYLARDISKLFELVADEDGELRLSQFQELMTQMGIGLGYSRIRSLFRSFDTDSSGTVSASEFTRALFPGSVCTEVDGSDSSEDA
jgi:hypothetical protein